MICSRFSSRKHHFTIRSSKLWKEITAILDAELKAWLNDPKARQQDRIAAALSVYARQNSEFARFMQDTGAKLGVVIPGVAK